MRVDLRRGARPWVAPLTLVLLVGLATGCTSKGSSGASAATDNSSPSAVAAATADPATQRAIDAAIARTRELHNYAFRATTRIGATSVARTSINGRVTRHGLAYVLRTAHRRTEVVRVSAGTYVRRGHGHWSRLVHPHALLRPTKSLVALLRGLVPQHVRTGAAGRTRVYALLPVDAAKRAGLPGESRVGAIVVTLDHRRRVHAIRVRTVAGVGGRDVAVAIETTYFRFGTAKAVRKPG